MVWPSGYTVIGRFARMERDRIMPDSGPDSRKLPASRFRPALLIPVLVIAFLVVLWFLTGQGR
jgi:hypothetical protein